MEFEIDEKRKEYSDMIEALNNELLQLQQQAEYQ